MVRSTTPRAVRAMSDTAITATLYRERLTVDEVRLELNDAPQHGLVSIIVTFTTSERYLEQKRQPPNGR